MNLSQRPSVRQRFTAESFCRALLLLGLGAVVACSGSKEPEPLPSQTSATVTPQLEPPPPPPIREVTPAKRNTVKVIDAGDESDEELTLAEASRRAKQRKTATREPVARITDKNLHEYAEGADVIVLESAPVAPPPPEIVETPSREADRREGAQDFSGQDARSEDYWRTRALEIRMGWRRTVDRIEELELESAALRQQFYAEEDPYIRDSQLKPAWDRTLDRLEELRDRSVRYEQELEFFVEEGRRAWALQGWLNQGWELEPSEEERQRAERRAEGHESIDPPVLEEDDGP